MPKRLSRQRIEEIREEVKAISRGDRRSDPKPAAVRKTLSCGHDDEVPLSLDPVKAVCSQCRAKSMRSDQT